MSSKCAKSKCLGPQFPCKNDACSNNATTARNNDSYWLEIHKNDTCRLPKSEDQANIMEIELDECPYVENINGTIGEESCDRKNYAVCIKPGTVRPCSLNSDPSIPTSKN